MMEIASRFGRWRRRGEDETHLRPRKWMLLIVDGLVKCDCAPWNTEHAKDTAKSPTVTKRAWGTREVEKRTLPVLGLLGRAEEDFANEALGGLGEEHGDGVGYVSGLEHFFRVFCGAVREIRGNGAGANGRNADAVGAEIFRHAVGEAEQSPFGCAIGSAPGHGILTGQ